MTSSNAWLTVLILAGGSLREKQLGTAPALSQHPADLADGSGLARSRIALHYLHQSEGVSIKLLCDQGPNTPRPNVGDDQIKQLLIAPQRNVISSVRCALPHIPT
ncbi:hypothetical protein N8458_01295, partial [Synechococcus sp. AH-601-P18]|nr:hypothetical protein [Synechococcus sp. AH-601-P18]